MEFITNLFPEGVFDNLTNFDNLDSNTCWILLGCCIGLAIAYLPVK